ncbi:MAG: sensor histidine kinase [Bryobacteraceae bacterium]
MKRSLPENLQNRPGTETSRPRWDGELGSSQGFDEIEVLRSIVDDLSDGVLILDKDERVLLCNAAAESLLGCSAPLEDLLLPDGTACPAQDVPVRRALRGESVEKSVLILRSESSPSETRSESSRSEKWLSVDARPLRDKEGEIRAALVFYRDITERHESEQELQRSAETLAKSNEELQQFAYAASHDLQEPLRMIRSYVDLLVRRYSGKLDKDGVEFLETVQDGAVRMSKLISDLLSYSRLGGGVLRPERTSLDAVLEWVKLNLGASLEESGATVTSGSLPEVMADQNQLMQVFQNLLSNAIKYRRTEPLRIHISATTEGKYIRVSVQDNGQGFDQQHAERIFGVFKRLHGRDIPGTGMGLAISRKIIERHGGKIWAEAQPDKGSTFIFTLPLR